jgi:uncharacterized protein (DUF305 family)
MKTNYLISAALIVAFCFFQSCNGGDKNAKGADTASHDNSATGGHNNHSSNGEHDRMMKKMMDDMAAVKSTGDFDLDFAGMMIPHHQGAVDMSEAYLSKAKDEKIKSIAQNIINSQTKEIEELKALMASHKPAEKKEEKASGHAGGGHNELMEAMNKMMDEMKGIKMTGDADKDFVTMMIPHHQSAIEMAENEISHGKNVQMKQFAQKVINDQSKEINEFKTWLKGR